MGSSIVSQDPKLFLDEANGTSTGSSGSALARCKVSRVNLLLSVPEPIDHDDKFVVRLTSH